MANLSFLGARLCRPAGLHEVHPFSGFVNVSAFCCALSVLRMEYWAARRKRGDVRGSFRVGPRKRSQHKTVSTDLHFKLPPILRVPGFTFTENELAAIGLEPHQRIAKRSARRGPCAGQGWVAPLPIDTALLVYVLETDALKRETIARSEWAYFWKAELQQIKSSFGEFLGKDKARTLAPKTLAVSLGAWIRSNKHSDTDPNLKCGFRMGVRANPAKSNSIPDVEDIGRKKNKDFLEVASMPEAMVASPLIGTVEYGTWPQGLNFPNYTTHCGADVGGKPLPREADRGSLALRVMHEGMLAAAVAGFSIIYRASSEAILIEQILCGGLYKPYSYKFQYADGNLSKIRLDKNPRPTDGMFESDLKKLKRRVTRRSIFKFWQVLFNPGGWHYEDGAWKYWEPQPLRAGFEGAIRAHPDFDVHVALHANLFNGLSIVDIAPYSRTIANTLCKQLNDAAALMLSQALTFDGVTITMVKSKWRGLPFLRTLPLPEHWQDPDPGYGFFVVKELNHRKELVLLGDDLSVTKSGPLWGTPYTPDKDFVDELRAQLDVLRKAVVANARKYAKRGIGTPWYAAVKAREAQKRVERQLRRITTLYYRFADGARKAKKI